MSLVNEAALHHHSLYMPVSGGTTKQNQHCQNPWHINRSEFHHELVGNWPSFKTDAANEGKYYIRMGHDMSFPICTIVRSDLCEGRGNKIR